MLFMNEGQCPQLESNIDHDLVSDWPSATRPVTPGRLLVIISLYATFLCPVKPSASSRLNLQSVSASNLTETIFLL